MTRVEGMPSVAQLVDVTKSFGVNGHKTAAVRNVSLQASLGELLLLLGPSGSGKTTLLTLIAGLIKPTWGAVALFGKNIEGYGSGALQQLRAMRIGFVFQTFHLIDSLTVLENVMVVLRFAGIGRNEARRRARTLLEQFHIEHLSKQFPERLSQGEKQRVAIARAIANDPDLIIADEATASLDTKHGLEIIRLLRDFVKENSKCVIATSHDPRIEGFADRVLRLEDGVLV
jgi:putative ABC transport system ATP-binding protein